MSVEQLYPFPEKELEAAIGQFPSAREVVWVQEEPANMGALFYVLPRLRRIAGERAGAVGKALRQRQPSHRISQGARSGAENVAHAGLSQQDLERC